MFTINCRGKLLSLETPVVMGIINATPDSFYEGHLEDGTEKMLALAAEMLGEGASILDIGGQSTRPGSTRLTAEEEFSRIGPLLHCILEQFPQAIISVDTYSSDVARAALASGAHIINDISAGRLDENMIPLVASYGNVPYVCMHMKGSPENMQALAQYEDIAMEVIDYFIGKITNCRKAGIKDIIIDPGFGFAKNATHNFKLLRNLQQLQILDCPLLAGISRKATIYKTLGITAAEALNGTTVLNTVALLNGANILRVHDVKEAKEAITLVQQLNNA